MPSLEFFTLTGTLNAVVVDYVDVGDDPDIQAISATVEFRPRIPSGKLIWASGLTPPQGVALAPIKARFDTDGVLRTIQDAAVNEKQTISITGSPTSYKLAFNGSATSTAIAGNADPEDVEAAIAALSTVGTGNVNVGGTAGGPYNVFFVNALAAQDVPALVVSDIVGGTAPTVVVTTPITGSLEAGVKLTANTSVLGLGEYDPTTQKGGLVYDCILTNVVYNSADQRIDSFGIVAPTTGGGTVDLADIEQVPPLAGL